MSESEAPTEAQRQEILFAQLISMLQGWTMQHLGKIKNPVTDRVERDLEQARFTLDLLGMLEAKTRASLNDQEKRFLDHILFELRMNYVDEVNRPQSQEKTEEGPEEKKAESSS